MRNEEILVGWIEAVVTGAAGRCGVGVWSLVCGCVKEWGGGGLGLWEGKVDFYKTRWKTITCPRAIGWSLAVMVQNVCFCAFLWKKRKKARRRRRNFSKVDFTPFSGLVWTNQCRKWTQRAEKHNLV